MTLYLLRKTAVFCEAEGRMDGFEDSLYSSFSTRNQKSVSRMLVPFEVLLSDIVDKARLIKGTNYLEPGSAIP